MVEELEEIRERFGDERRTEIAGAVEGLTTEDLIVEEDMVVTVSHLGYVKRNPMTQYRAQRRGGKGLKGMETREEDFVERLFVASTHAYDPLLHEPRAACTGRRCYELPQLGRAARGKALVNLLQLGEGERVQAALPVRSSSEGAVEYVLIAHAPGRHQEDGPRRPTRTRAAAASSPSTSTRATR